MGDGRSKQDVASRSGPQAYQSRLRGHLSRRWEATFEGWSIELDQGGDTLLSGSVADQSALHALLRRVRDLGLPVVSVIQLEPAIVFKG